MASEEKTLRDALVSGINAAAALDVFSMQFTAVGNFDVSIDGEDQDALSIRVFPLSRAFIERGRAGRTIDYTFGVAIHKPVSEIAATRETEVDELLTLADEIEAWLSENQGVVSFDDAGEEAPYNLDLLRDESVFQRVVLPVYRKHLSNAIS